MRKTILKVIALLAIPFAMVGLSSGDTYADVSTIPEGQPFTDINFYNCVVNKIGADNVAVTGPTTEQLESITSLACSGYQKPEAEKIKDASGLEKMTALTYLNLSHNQLASIDLTKNTALKDLNLYSNQLTSIDVSKNTALNYLYLDSNQLTSIDLTKNTALTGLRLPGNKFTEVDLSKNTALSYIYIYDNQLTSIDLTNNPALTGFVAYSNQLTSIDLTNNPALTRLNIRRNKITEIDISHNTALSQLWVDNIRVKTQITRSYSSTPTDFDLSSFKFLDSVTPGEGYSFNSDTKILSVSNPDVTMLIPAKAFTDMSSGGEIFLCNIQLVLYNESTPTPDPDAEGEDIVVPNTGTITGTEGGALAIFAASTAVILAIIGLATHLKNRNKDHYVFDK